MNWYTIDLGDALLAGPAFDDLELQLIKICEQAGNPADMAAYYRHETAANLFCSVSVYLTPGFASHASELDATPCAAPHPSGLSLLVGTGDADD